VRPALASTDLQGPGLHLPSHSVLAGVRICGPVLCPPTSLPLPARALGQKEILEIMHSVAGMGTSRAQVGIRYPKLNYLKSSHR
jgi:hypothetical protein